MGSKRGLLEKFSIRTLSKQGMSSSMSSIIKLEVLRWRASLETKGCQFRVRTLSNKVFGKFSIYLRYNISDTQLRNFDESLVISFLLCFTFFWKNSGAMNSAEFTHSQRSKLSFRSYTCLQPSKISSYTVH
jgi:hypothetical protein